MMWFFLGIAVIQSRRAAEGRDGSNGNARGPVAFHTDG
jgi:hypothetical protein